MAYPPVIPPATRANATPLLDSHPADHNALSTALSAMPWGRVASATSTATTAAIGATLTDVVSVTFTAVAGRRYRVSGTYLGIVQSVASAVAAYIRDGANVVLNTSSMSNAVGYWFALTVWAEIAPAAAGSRTYKLSAAVAAGGGTITLNGSAAAFHQILVEDIGS